MARRKRKKRSACPLSAALDIVGDRWSLLVVRDLMFLGRSSYKAMLASDERIATNILADRLARLETAGIIEKRPDPDDRRGYLYRLTPKGVDLAPVLVEMIVWSAKHECPTPTEKLHDMTTRRTQFLRQLRKRLLSDAADSVGPSLAD